MAPLERPGPRLQTRDIPTYPVASLHASSSRVTTWHCADDRVAEASSGYHRHAKREHRRDKFACSKSDLRMLAFELAFLLLSPVVGGQIHKIHLLQIVAQLLLDQHQPRAYPGSCLIAASEPQLNHPPG